MYTSEKILPYVYILIHRISGEFYIGSRYSKYLNKPSHLDILSYQSSSKLVKSIGFSNFDVLIVAEFFIPSDAWCFEQQLIMENYKNPLILNKHVFTNYTESKFIFKSHTKESKQNLSDYWKGVPKPKEQVEKIRKALTGRKMTPEQCIKISNAQIGKKRGKYKKKVKSH